MQRSDLRLWSAASPARRMVRIWSTAGMGSLLLGPVGPEDFEFVDVGGGSRGRSGAGIGAGGVAAAGENVGSLAGASGSEEDLGADGVAGRLEAGHWRRRLCNQFQTEPVVGGFGYVAEKGGRWNRCYLGLRRCGRR